MGKKGKKATHGGKKKTKQSQHIPPSVNENNNDNGICQEVVDELDFIMKDKRGQFCNEIIHEKLLLPDKPKMTLDPLAMKQKLLSIPTNERTATAERLIKAQSMMDDIEKIQSDRDDDDNKNEKNIDILKTDKSYLRECVLWIKAFTSSDYRVSCTREVLFGSPLPSSWAHITLSPLEDNEPQLMNVDALSFVVLLATAIRLLMTQRRFSLQIAYELHAHAEGKYDWLDFDELQNHGETEELDESFLRFALACVGIKGARAMYRDNDQRTPLEQLQKKDDIAIQSKSLLRSIETLANEQCQYNPNSPVGLWNLGWVASQVKHNGKHPWRAANDFYNFLSDCCILADKVDDDFYCAEAGIEVAMSLVLGGKPIVGYSLERVLLRQTCIIT